MIKRKTTCRIPGHGTTCEVAAEILQRHPRTTEERLALAYENMANHNWRYLVNRKQDQPYDADRAVDAYIASTNDNPPVPTEHGCTGDTCWCKHF